MLLPLQGVSTYESLDRVLINPGMFFQHWNGQFETQVEVRALEHSLARAAEAKKEVIVVDEIL